MDGFFLDGERFLKAYPSDKGEIFAYFTYISILPRREPLRD